MTLISKFVTFLVSVSVLISKNAAVDFQEGSCFAIPTARHLDGNWLMTNTDNWNVLMASQLEVDRILQDLTQKSLSDWIQNPDLKKACIQTNWDSTFTTAFISGFQHKYRREYIIKHEDEGTRWTPIGIQDPLTGRVNLTFTDNQDFVVANNCWDDGQRTFFVLSPHKRLAPTSKMMIIEYLKSAGFQTEFMMEIDYSLC